MSRRETITSRVLTALDEAELAVASGDTEGALGCLRAAKLETIDWQYTVDTTIYKIQHGEAPDPPTTPWFTRRARQNTELREVVELDAYRNRKRAA